MNADERAYAALRRGDPFGNVHTAVHQLKLACDKASVLPSPLIDPSYGVPPLPAHAILLLRHAHRLAREACDMIEEHAREHTRPLCDTLRARIQQTT